MDRKKGILGWPKWGRVTMQVSLMCIFCLLLLFAPQLFRETVMNAFRAVAADASVTAESAGGVFFQTVYLWFAGLLGGMLIINLVFFSFDESLSDTVLWRRAVQILTNIVLVIGGAVLIWYTTAVYFPAISWWESILLSSVAARRLAWLPAAVYAGGAVLQMIWDVWLFAALNRSPWYRRIATGKEKE